MKLYALAIAFFCHFTIMAQASDFISTNVTVNTFVDGTLTFPNEAKNPSLAILISDYGPIDRDGNQNFQKNNLLKKLAEGLSSHGIAAFRYDKRIVRQIQRGRVDKTITFDDFVTDAISIINYFKNSKQFKNIYVIGHGQGSLVGMIAAQEYADGFISLAGSAKTIDTVILEQINKTVPGLVNESEKVFNVLRQGKTTDSFPPALASIFNKDTQPFMSSWMQYNPQEILKTLNMPVLIINGTKDLQVPEDEAEQLHTAAPNSSLKIIENMNHVLFTIQGDDLENSKSYNESFRKLSEAVIPTLVDFIK